MEEAVYTLIVYYAANRPEGTEWGLFFASAAQKLGQSFGRIPMGSMQ